MSKIHSLKDQLNTKPWVTDVCYEVITGSVSYGISTDYSDLDIVGICVPSLDIIFPHTAGYIKNFGPAPENFETYQKHHIFDSKGQECDVSIYSIITFFQLASENNPNILDIINMHDRHILHIDNVGKIIKQYRTSFPHRGCMYKFLGYAHQQLKNIKNKTPTGKRKELVEKYGVDTKYLSHLYRLTLECEELLLTGELTLEKNAEILRAVRNGSYTLAEAEVWFKEKEKHLNELYLTSPLPYKPDYDHLKRVLLMCIEEKWGSLDKYINTSADATVLRKYEQIVKIING